MGLRLETIGDLSPYAYNIQHEVKSLSVNSEQPAVQQPQTEDISKQSNILVRRLRQGPNM